MKKKILDRYEQTNEGYVIIDVATKRVEDLYEDFDKTAPYHKKDLDEDLVYYLTECVREIGHSKFVLRFVFEQFPSEQFTLRVRTSIQKFFLYQRELEFTAMKKMLRTSMILFTTGIAILFISLWVEHLIHMAEKEYFLNSVFAEGLTIVAWVSMWEGLATLMLNLVPHLYHLKLFRNIAEAQVLFYHPSTVYSDNSEDIS
ncbi:MAG: hypothetical protein WCK32_08430 [Chlorobiaceae bacterium]